MIWLDIMIIYLSKSPLDIGALTNIMEWCRIKSICNRDSLTNPMRMQICAVRIISIIVGLFFFKDMFFVFLMYKLCCCDTTHTVSDLIAMVVPSHL